MSKDTTPTECGEFEVIAVTDLALLLVDDAGDEIWVPKSQMDPAGGIDAVSKVGEFGDLIIPEWLAVEKGLE